MTARPGLAKSSAKRLLHEARRELEASIANLSDEQMAVSVTAGWSVKDVLAHVTMWDEVELIEMRRALRGHATPFDHRFDDSLIDRLNDVHFELRKPLPLAEVVDDLHEARRALMQSVESLSEAEFTTGFIPVACGVQAKHDRDHASQISHWRREEGI